MNTAKNQNLIKTKLGASSLIAAAIDMTSSAYMARNVNYESPVANEHPDRVTRHKATALHCNIAERDCYYTSDYTSLDGAMSMKSCIGCSLAILSSQFWSGYHLLSPVLIIRRCLSLASVFPDLILP